MDGLFSLLSIYFPNDPRPRDKTLKRAWLLVLEEYRPEDVRKALVSFLRESKNFPFVQEIAMRCQNAPSQEIGSRKRDDPGAAPGPVEQKCLDRSREWQEQWHQELKERGLPNMREAIEAGMSLGQWRKQLEDAGVWK